MRQSVLLLFGVLIGLCALFVSAQELDPFLSDDEFSKADLKNIDSHTEYPNGVNVIPGEAELDYPTFHLIPKTSFTCEGKIPGFYTDVEARCQAWHTCDVDARMQTFLCPNGTIYSQEKRVCEWWYNVNCDAKEVNRYLDQNRLLYISPRDNASQLANVDIPRKVIPNNNNAPKSQQQYSQQQQQQQRPQQQYSQQQPQQQQRGQQQRPEPSYSQQLQQNYAPNPTQDYYQQTNQQNYSPTPQAQRQTPAPPQQRTQQQQNYSPAPQQRPQQNYSPAPPQQQQQQRPQQQQNYSPAPPQRSQQNYSPAPVQQQRSQQKSTPAPPQQQRVQQQQNYSPAPVQSRPQQQSYSPAPPQQRPSQQQNNYSPPPTQQQQNYSPVSQQQRTQQQNYSPAPPQNNRPQQNNSPAPAQQRTQQQNYTPAPQQSRPQQQQSYSPAPQQQQSYSPAPQQQQSYSPAPQQQNYNPSQSQRTNSNGQNSSRQQPQDRPSKQIPSPLTVAVEAATGAVPQGPNRFQSQQPRQQSQPKQQQRYQPDQDYNRYDGQQSNNDYRPTDYDRSQQSRNPAPQQQRNSSPLPQQQRANQAPRSQQQPQQQRRPQSAPSHQDQRQQSYDGQSYNQEQNRAPSQGSRSNNIAPEPRPKTTPAPPPPPPQAKFRHSTPRKHNVKFASTSRQQYYDDGKESQIPSESQQQGFPYSQVYNRNYEKISQYQAVQQQQQQQQQTSEPTTLAPQVLNRYEVSPPPQLTPEVPTARRVPQNYRPEPSAVPLDFNNAPFGLEGTSTYEQLQASRQSSDIVQQVPVPQQRRGRLNPATATRIVVKPRLENKNQAFEIRAARREDRNPEIIYPAPLEVSEDEEYAIKSQFAAAEVNYGRRQ